MSVRQSTTKAEIICSGFLQTRGPWHSAREEADSLGTSSCLRGGINQRCLGIIRPAAKRLLCMGMTSKTGGDLLLISEFIYF